MLTIKVVIKDILQINKGISSLTVLNLLWIFNKILTNLVIYDMKIVNLINLT